VKATTAPLAAVGAAAAAAGAAAGVSDATKAGSVLPGALGGPKLPALPLMRAASCPGGKEPPGQEPRGSGSGPTSLDDTELPMGLGNQPASGAAKKGSAKVPAGPSGGDAGGSLSDLGSLSSMPWLASLQGAYPEQAKQAELHCRAAVAAARAAMDGNSSSSLNSASLALMANMGGRLPVLQSLMSPLGGTSASSLLLPGGPSLFDPTGVGAFGDIDVDSLPDDVRSQLLGELGERGDGGFPLVGETSTTAEALLDQMDTGDGPAPAAGRRPGRPWLQHPAIKKRAVGSGGGGKIDGVPLQRSGCSGLLDDMSLSGASPTDETSDSEPSGTSVEGLAASSFAAKFGACLPPATDAEASMQAAADEYVQVITAAAAPFQIVFASAAWMSLCEYSNQEEVLGQTLDLLDGPLTQRDRAEDLMGSIRDGRPCSLNITHHTRTGKPFSHDVRLEPLRDSQGKLHCFQATSSNIVMLDAEAVPAAAAAAAEAAAAVAARQGGAGEARGGQSESTPMSRTDSALKINDVLDLFTEPGADKADKADSPLESESAVVNAFLDLA